MRISDWSSDVCSSDLNTTGKGRPTHSLRPGSAPPHRLSLPSRAGEDESHHASKQNRAKEKQYAGFLSQLWPLATHSAHRHRCYFLFAEGQGQQIGRAHV